MTFVLRYSKNEFEGTQILISIILSCHAHLTIWPVLIALISKPKLILGNRIYYEKCMA